MKTDFNPVQRSLSFVTSPSQEIWQSNRLRRIWDRFVRYCLSSPEPRITLKRDRSGEHYWAVYDPTHQRSLTFGTAHEVRVWLEDRYSR